MYIYFKKILCEGFCSKLSILFFKSWSLSFSGGSVAIAPPSLNFCMQPCVIIVLLIIEERANYTITSTS